MTEDDPAATIIKSCYNCAEDEYNRAPGECIMGDLRCTGRLTPLRIVLIYALVGAYGYYSPTYWFHKYSSIPIHSL